MEDLNVRSSAFAENGNIPPQYTCDGGGINPPIQLESVPDEAKSLAIIVEDPDAPNGTFCHWIAWNMSAVDPVVENIKTATNGINSAGKIGYYGPCPPNGYHRYYFNLFALDTFLDLQEGATKDELEKAMKGHILAKGSLMAKYQLQKES